MRAAAPVAVVRMQVGMDGGVPMPPRPTDAGAGPGPGPAPMTDAAPMPDAAPIIIGRDGGLR
ncbi:MAG TPA: hypothetical protein VFS15_04075 [Kofleriaceae bacterium]|nr:hypothetical protein [Kofleriaceae bacterium]